MTVYKVMDNLKSFILEAVKEAHLTTKNNEGKIPSVILGYLDPLDNEKDEKEDFPYVIIRYIDDQIEDDSSNLKLKLIFGIHSEDFCGWVDVLHLFELVKIAILKSPIFGFYTVDKPIKSSIPEEQPYPYFYGFMDLNLTIPQIQVEGV